ncbi:MAG: hypothetical protein ACRC8S_09025 [Fimbriiglobus sp.]
MITKPLAIKLGLVAILLTILATGVWYATSRPATIDDQAARQIAEGFLAKLRQGQAEIAWKEATAEFQSLQGKDSFKAYVKGQASLKAAAEFQDAQMSSKNGLNLCVCTFHAGKSTLRVTLAPEQKQWKVERLVVE